MTLGMIARADDGGLGAMTWEVWRHLRPARTLIVLADHRTRGTAHPERFDGPGEVRVTARFPRPADVAWLTRDVDVVYSAETFYGARIRGPRTALHVMPEMHARDTADAMLLPTPWRAEHFPGAALLPVPVARDRLPFRQRTEATTLYHVAGNAMADRNGTDLLLSALPHVRRRCTLLIRGGQPHVERHGLVNVEWLGHHHGAYWGAWPEEADVLVLPRRFGGLCLPILEATSLGLPIVTLDLDPQRQWLPSEGLVPVTGSTPVRMRGGSVDVHDADPCALAAHIDRLLADPPLVAALSARSQVFADGFSWEALLPAWQATLGLLPCTTSA